MARVFLSYDREDVGRAQSIAELLESAGHSVWWDRHIKGGAQFSKEIEKELERAQAVLVLWSERSVESAWVTDEAAAGRDSGRLVPILLDRAKPPLGFRQYQNIDLRNWKGGDHSREVNQLLVSIDSLAGETPPPHRKEGSDRTKRALPIRAMAAVATVLLVVVAAVIWMERGGEAGVRTVVVQSADASPANQAVARDLLVRLTTLQTASAGLVRLQGGEPRAPVKADLVFEAAASRDRQDIGQSLALLDGKDRAVLWSKDFEQGSGSRADLKLQVAYTAARVLQCALEALPPGKRSLDQPTLKLYLNGCALLAEGYGASAASLIPVFSNVVKNAPGFRAGWAKLLLADASVLGQQSTPEVQASARRHLREARKLTPDLAEATILEVSLLPLSSYPYALRLLDTAKTQYPDNPEVLSSRVDALLAVGRMRESIEDAKRAADLDPLSPSTRSSYVLALAYAGRVDAAKKELQALERLWPGTAILQEIQFRFHLRFGDPKKALDMARSLDIGGENQERFLIARANPTQENIDYMISHAQRDNGYLGFMAQALGEFGRNEQLFELLDNWPNREDLPGLGNVYFRPALSGLRHDKRFMQIAAKAGLVSYWKSSGHWPDFCAEPDLPYKCEEAAKQVPV